MDGSIKMPFEVVSRVGLMNHVLDGIQIPTTGKGFWEDGTAQCNAIQAACTICATRPNNTAYDFKTLWESQIFWQKSDKRIL